VGGVSISIKQKIAYLKIILLIIAAGMSPGDLAEVIWEQMLQVF
jgi:hypothetical protein